jgi:hypothetical protein
MDGLHAVFYLSATLCLIAAIASLLRGKRVIADDLASSKSATTPEVTHVAD